MRLEAIYRECVEVVECALSTDSQGTGTAMMCSYNLELLHINEAIMARATFVVSHRVHSARTWQLQAFAKGKP